MTDTRKTHWEEDTVVYCNCRSPQSLNTVQEWTVGGHMDWITLLVISFALLCICHMDGNAMFEVRLFFKDLTKAACHFYLALLPLRRAATHFIKCVRHLVSHPQQNSYPHIFLQDQPLAQGSMLHFLEGISVVCETVPNLMAAALSMGTAFFHIPQGGFYSMAAVVRTIQTSLFSQIPGEKERWDNERLRAKEKEKREFQRAGLNQSVLLAPC